MSDVTPSSEGALAPEGENESSMQAARQAPPHDSPEDDYPEIELTAFDAHRASLRGIDEAMSTTEDPDSPPPAPPPLGP